MPLSDTTRVGMNTTFRGRRNQILMMELVITEVGMPWLASLFTSCSAGRPMRGRNEALDVYPNRPAPVVLEQDGERIVRQDMLWGFPPFKPGAGYGTNFRSLKNHLWRGWLDREHRCVVPATAFSEPDKNTPKGGVALVRARRQAAILLCRDLAPMDWRSRHQENTQHRRPHAVLNHDD